MREWENATWASGVSGEQVIANVGRIVAARLLELAGPSARFLLLAGKGHNGDDVRQAAPHLPSGNVELLNVWDSAGDVQTLRQAIARKPDWIVDGLFGIGLNRPLDAGWQKLITAINDSGINVLSVDTPSGLNADTGAVEGPAVRATLTLTLGAPKRGLIESQVSNHVGRLEVAPEIGLVSCHFKSDLNWTLPGDFAGLPPRRPVDSHKGSYGHLAIFAGSVGYHGAAVLAAKGALRAQPGLVSVFPQAGVYVPVAGQLAQTMVHPWKESQKLPEKCSAVLIGPGLAADDLPPGLKTQMRSLWQDSSLPVIADASALGWLPRGPVRPDSIRVITPHPGEAARMLGNSTEKVQADRLGALRELSNQWGRCLVVLKGHQTLVGRHVGEVFINSSGNPHLAQGGSGDVLAGFMAGLFAQQSFRADPMLTARLAVWRHGAAADDLQASGDTWTMDDLLGELGTCRPGGS